MSQDVENLIPTCNIVRENDCVRVVSKRKNDEYTETNVEMIRVLNNITNNPITYQNSNKIHHAVCLAIEDIKRSKYDQNCWKFHNISFKNVLLYGRVIILNECSRYSRTFYTLQLDDETECIDGYLNKVCSKSDTSDKNAHQFSKGKSTLERRRETGINLYGQYYPKESEECKTLVSNLKKLQIMIENNLKSSEKNFQLGPLKEKALIYGTPIYRNEEILLNIFDLSIDDSLDLSWKRNINRLYSDFYFK